MRLSGVRHSWLGLPFWADAMLAAAILAVTGVVVLVGVFIFLVLSMPTPGTPPPGPTPPPGTVLFRDDFSDPASGWYQVHRQVGEVSYVPGGYEVRVSSQHRTITAPNQHLQNYGDVRVEVDATAAGGPLDNGFGIVCRYRDDDDYYMLWATSEGTYAIGKVGLGHWLILATSRAATSAAIRQGYATNHLRADCNGDTLALWVNGQRLLSVQDADFRAGGIRLAAFANDAPDVSIVFSNLVVSQP